jgi:hypothetical protein
MTGLFKLLKATRAFYFAIYYGSPCNSGTKYNLLNLQSTSDESS